MPATAAKLNVVRQNKAHDLKNVLQILSSSVHFLESQSETNIDDLRFVTRYARRLLAVSMGEGQHETTRGDIVDELCRGIRCAESGGTVNLMTLRCALKVAPSTSLIGDIWHLAMSLLALLRASVKEPSPVPVNVGIVRRTGFVVATITVEDRTVDASMFQNETPSWRSIHSRVWTLGGTIETRGSLDRNITVQLALPSPASPNK